MMDFTEALHLGPWLLYGAVLIAPSVQEDSAVIGAAAVAASGQAEPLMLFAVVLAGLTASDVWKYAAGAWLPKSRFVQRQFANPRLQAVKAAVHERLGLSLLLARFVPGLRIPTYVACGAFGANFYRYLLILTLAGALYVGLAFVLMHWLGAAGVPYLTLIVPIVLVSAIAIAWTSTLVVRRARVRADALTLVR